MFKLVLTIFCLSELVSRIDVTMAMQIRLIPTNTEGTAGFVEAFYNGTWGFVGNPVFLFSETTAGVLCRILGKSILGYGANWTPLNNSTKYTFVNAKIECHGNETDAGQCTRLGTWTESDFSGERDWGYKYGSRLYCVESRLVGGNTPNSGVVESVFDGEVYQMCFKGFNMNTADVVCRNLGYEKALSIEAVNRTTQVYKKTLVCNGRESSLSKCHQRKRTLPCKNQVASITCEAVRFNALNEHKDEGVVEVFYNGSWGMVGNPGYQFDDVTASYLCKRFGLGDVGFGSRSQYLGQYERIAWLDELRCHNNETNIMDCSHDPFSVVPPVLHTYKAGSWLHCFPYKFDGIRLTNSTNDYEGRVELSINGRWGSICVSQLSNASKLVVGRLICQELGHTDIDEVFYTDNIGEKDDFFWLSQFSCHGNESNISECTVVQKGSSYQCFMSKEYLRIRCKPFNIRLIPSSVTGNVGFVEAKYDGIWGLVGNPELIFSDTTASVLCRILGIGNFGYGAGWSPMNTYTSYTWENAILECHGNEKYAGQCKRLGSWAKLNTSTSWAYKYGSKLHCVESRLVEGITPNSGVVESTFNGEVYQMCFEGFSKTAADVVCRNLGYEKALSIEAAKRTTRAYRKTLVCNGQESSLSKCLQIRKKRKLPCDQVASVTCEAVRLKPLNEYKDEGVVEVFYKGSWGMVGNPGYQFDDETAAYLCRRFGLGDVGFGTQSGHLGHYEGVAWLDYLNCHKNETNIMDCTHDPFSVVPPLMHTYRSGPWLHCYPFNVRAVRLSNMSGRSNEGRVEININDRWGSICTSRMKYAQQRFVGKLICNKLAFTDIDEVISTDNIGEKEDLFWMRQVWCKGHETDISECSYYKGSSHECYSSREYLRIRCKPEDL